MTSTILKDNLNYWTSRATGYSDVNKKELATEQRCRWQQALCDELNAQFPGVPHSEISILDIGTGPGFFSIILAEEGYCVTAIDLTPSMLDEARFNAGSYADLIQFMTMNAEDLSFPDHSFDAIVTRNLTWNLPHPEKAYSEWARVLRPGGILMNFDANWYHHLIDSDARERYEDDRRKTKALGYHDENIGDGFERMDEIAYQLPLTKVQRPEWDLKVLRSLGLSVEAYVHIGKKVWSEEEQVNFSSTPLFMLCGKK